MTKEKNNKTHWLENPNKNFLGHQDLPNGENQTLTVKSGKWEEVKNPRLNTKDIIFSQEKRVLRWEEEGKLKWVKPFICNETNALDICKKLQIEFIDDCVGAKITLTIKEVSFGKIKMKGLRILDAKMKENIDKINEEEKKELLDLINNQDKTDPIKICKAFNIKSLGDLPKENLELVKKGIKKYIENENI